MPCYASGLVAIGLLSGLHGQVTPAPGNVFEHPEILCSALKPEGIQTLDWAPVTRRAESGNSRYIPYVCQYDGLLPAGPSHGPSNRSSQTIPELEEISPHKPPPPAATSVVFRVSGSGPSRADNVTIAITIHRPEGKDMAEGQILQLITTLFRAIGQSVPVGLRRHISTRSHFISHQTYGTVWFSSLGPDTQKEPVLWFQLRKRG